MILIVMFSAIPFTPFQYKLNFIEQVFTYTSQGWAFFTRDAREEQVYIYKIGNNKLEKINQKHSNFINFMGLSRRVSKLTIETEIISNFIDKKNLQEQLGITIKIFTDKFRVNL